MNKILQVISLTFALLLCSITAKAQDNGINSPFSRYGVGLLSNQAQSFNQGMAGLSYGMRDGRELNFKNPASYSAIDSLTFLFDMGMSLQNGNFDEGNKAANVKNASFDYLSAGFRLHKGVGMSLGVMPISNIGYKVTGVPTEIPGGITGNVTASTTYSGSGGLREAYVGFAYAPVKEISFGVNGGYVWGAMNHVVMNNLSDSNMPNTNLIYSTHLRTYDFTAGLQWHQRVGHDHFTLGLTYGLGHDIGGKSYLYTQLINSGTVQSADTLVAENAWSLPHTYGAGLTWEHGKGLRIGVDYTLQQWSKAKQPIHDQSRPEGQQYYGAAQGYDDVNRFTVGAEYVKDPNGLTWASRVRYRAGFSYGNNYTRINGGKAPKNYLASLGVALPIINIYNNRTFVNVGVQYERVQPQMPGQLTENYFRINLGISFNERWFMKWKVE